MKKLLLGSVVLLVLTLSITMIQMSSCAKANSQTITKTDTVYVNTCSADSITGLWVGTYTSIGSSLAPQRYNFVIKPDGSIINETQTNGDTNSEYINIGTWQLSGNTLSATYTNVYGIGTSSYIGNVQTASATLNTTNGTLTGTFSNGGGIVAGNITLTKVN